MIGDSAGERPVPPPPSRASAALAVGIGGAAGALARAAVDVAVPHEPGAWPWSTLLVNATGSLALAVLVVVLTARRPDDGYARLLLGTGLLGGYTTFSTFSVDAVHLLDADRPAAALAYVSSSLLAALVAVVAGLHLGRGLVRGR